MPETVPTPTEHIIVTANTDAIRSTIHAEHDGKGCELVNSSPTTIVWRWYNAPVEALTAIKNLVGHHVTIKIS